MLTISTFISSLDAQQIVRCRHSIGLGCNLGIYHVPRSPSWFPLVPRSGSSRCTGQPSCQTTRCVFENSVFTNSFTSCGDKWWAITVGCHVPKSYRYWPGALRTAWNAYHVSAMKLVLKVLTQIFQCDIDEGLILQTAQLIKSLKLAASIVRCRPYSGWLNLILPLGCWIYLCQHWWLLLREKQKRWWWYCWRFGLFSPEGSYINIHGQMQRSFHLEWRPSQTKFIILDCTWDIIYISEIAFHWAFFFGIRRKAGIVRSCHLVIPLLSLIVSLSCSTVTRVGSHASCTLVHSRTRQGKQVCSRSRHHDHI